MGKYNKGFPEGNLSMHTKYCKSVPASESSNTAVKHPMGISLCGHRDSSTKLFTGMLLIRANSWKPPIHLCNRG